MLKQQRMVSGFSDTTCCVRNEEAWNRCTLVACSICLLKNNKDDNFSSFNALLVQINHLANQYLWQTDNSFVAVKVPKTNETTSCFLLLIDLVMKSDGD